MLFRFTRTSCFWWQVFSQPWSCSILVLDLWYLLSRCHMVTRLCCWTLTPRNCPTHFTFYTACARHVMFGSSWSMRFWDGAGMFATQKMGSRGLGRERDRSWWQMNRAGLACWIWGQNLPIFRRNSRELHPHLEPFQALFFGELVSFYPSSTPCFSSKNPSRMAGSTLCKRKMIQKVTKNIHPQL